MLSMDLYVRDRLHWPPIIRIDQREVESLGALIKVRNAGQREFEPQLAQSKRPKQAVIALQE